MTPALRRAATAAVLAIAIPVASRAETVTVFAAASLANALAEIETAFEAETGHDLVVSLAGSSALARQIQQGAPADVFISASVEWMDVIEAEGLVDEGSRVDLLGNTIVLVAFGEAEALSIDADLDLTGLLDGGRLAMALVDSVPAGVYGRAALTTLGLWEAVAPRVAQTDNVRATLALVATGAAPFGIVYATDAAAEPSVSVVGTFPADTHPPIVYPVAGLTTRDTRAAAQFLAFLRGDAARAAFARQGFAVLAE